MSAEPSIIEFPWVVECKATPFAPWHRATYDRGLGRNFDHARKIEECERRTYKPAQVRILSRWK